MFLSFTIAKLLLFDDNQKVSDYALNPAVFCSI